jgi:negative regulator of flagellin synthesis FlgM
MKIDDRIVNYEISKQLSEASVKGVENIDEKQLSNEKKIEGAEQPKQAAVVSLSQASKESRQIKEIIESSPDIREDKVSHIKESIESGGYNIDNDRVADKLVNSVLEEIF